MNHPQQDPGLSTAAMAAAGERQAENQDMRARRAQEADRQLQPQPQPEPQPTPRPAPARPDDDTRGAQGRPAALLQPKEADNFRSRWSEVQTGFVDQPRQAVEQADALVAELMKRLAETFAGERSKLEQQWGRGDNVSTEELRVALQRYRSFFDRLLSV